jgi:hypothetical protein
VCTLRTVLGEACGCHCVSGGGERSMAVTKRTAIERKGTCGYEEKCSDRGKKCV